MMSAESGSVSAPQKGREIYCRPSQGSGIVPPALSRLGKTGSNTHSSALNHCDKSDIRRFINYIQ